MQDWLKVTIGAIAAAFVGGVTTILGKLWRRQKAYNAGLQALLHDRIYSLYEECSRKKYASMEDKRNMDYLYEPYHELGGNGTGTTFYKRVMDMPDCPAATEKIV